MNLKWPVVAAIVLLSMVLVAYALPSITGRAVGSRQKATVAYINFLSDLPVVVAREKGFYADEGLDVEFLRIGTSNQGTDLIASWRADLIFGISSIPLFAAETVTPGFFKLSCVSDLTEARPFDFVMVKNDSPITDVNQLAGKKLGMLAGSTNVAIFRDFFARRNVSGVEFIALPFENQLPALSVGAIDALYAFEPIRSIALDGGVARVIYTGPLSSLADHNPMGVCVMPTALIERDPQKAAALHRATMRGINYVNDPANDREVRDFAAGYFGLTPGAADRAILTYYVSSDAANVTALNDYAEWLYSAGEIRGRVNATSTLYRN